MTERDSATFQGRLGDRQDAGGPVNSPADGRAAAGEASTSPPLWSSTLDSVRRQWQGQWGSEPEAGLKPAQVEQVRAQHGWNELPQRARATWVQVLGRQFLDVMIGILLAAAVVSYAIGEAIDAWAILAIVILNGLLGFAQEWKAERALAALQKMLSPHCRVVRDGQRQEIPARELVPDDVVVLATGNRVPADLRLIEANELRLDESTLTGESVSVEKSAESVPAATPLAERTPMVWMGTAVTHGRGLGIVTQIGLKTELGRVAELTEDIQAGTTPLQRKLGTLARQLAVVATSLAIVIAIVGWFSGQPPVEMLLLGISIAVAVVPEGLPAVVTMTLALGIRAMVGRRALLRRLQAAEALGATTVICTDKTGTLTENQMTVRHIDFMDERLQVTGVGYSPQGDFLRQDNRIEAEQHARLQQFLLAALRCSHAELRQQEDQWQVLGEPTEGALVVAAHKGLAASQLSQPPRRLREHEFDSTRKRMSVVVDLGNGNSLVVAKGAPDVILPRCTQIVTSDGTRPLSSADRDRITASLAELASRGLRTLALAERLLPPATGDGSSQAAWPQWAADEFEQDLVWLGAVGMQDPPRPEVPEAIRKARSAGIRVLLITGDAAPTALAIAQQIGLNPNTIITGTELSEFSDEELDGRLTNSVLFARTTPEHKLRIVETLQRQGHIVAMTGDGVNDAPALKRADIGIAMGQRGTDVAQGAADIILTDDNFSSIINAVEEGRRQFENIQKFVRYLLSSNTGEVVAIMVNVIMGGNLILLPVQILWMNLITDGLTAVALGLDPAEPHLMQRPPRPPHLRLVSKSAFIMILVLGGYLGGVTLLLFYLYGSSGDERSRQVAQTMAFTGLIIAEKLNVLNFRSLRAPLSWRVLGSNLWVLGAMSLSIGLQILAVYLPSLQRALHTAPLLPQDWLIMLAAASPVILLGELVKWFLYRRHPKYARADAEL